MYKRERVLKPYCCTSDKVRKIELGIEKMKKRNIQNNWTSSDNLNQWKMHLHE